MQHIARQALRATSRSPAKLIAGRRYPRITVRAFHRTSVASHPRTPPSRLASDDTNNRRDIHTSQNHQGYSQVAQDLEQATKSGRSDGLPPVDFPDWFLDKNVILCEDNPVRAGIESEIWIQSEEPKSARGYSLTPSWPLIRTLCLSAWNKRPDTEITEDEFDRSLESLCAADPAILGLLKEADFPRDGKILNPLSRSEVKRKLAAILNAPFLDARSPRTNMKANALLRTTDQDDLIPLVKEMAGELNADVVHIDAQDIAELLGGYVSSKSPSKEIQNLGFDTYAERGVLMQESEQREEAEEEEDEQSDEDDEEHAPQSTRNNSISSVLKSQLFPLSRIAGMSAVVVDGVTGKRISLGSNQPSRGNNYDPEDRIDRLKIKTWLSNLLRLPQFKRSSRNGAANTRLVESAPSDHATSRSSNQPSTDTGAFEQNTRLVKAAFRGVEGPESSGHTFIADISALGDPGKEGDRKIEIRVSGRSRPGPPTQETPKTIVVVRDLKEVADVKVGDLILGELQKIIQDRRANGETIMLLGTSTKLPASRLPLGFIGQEPAPLYNVIDVQSLDLRGPGSEALEFTLKFLDLMEPDTWPQVVEQRTMEINARHILDMLRLSDIDSIVAAEPARELSAILPSHRQILSPEMVFEIILTTIGTRITRELTPQLSSLSEPISDDHSRAFSCLRDAVALLSGIKLTRDQRAPSNSSSQHVLSFAAKFGGASKAQPMMTWGRPAAARDNSHEKRLKGGIINPDDIHTTFQDVHVSPDTIDTLKMLTGLSLLRPEAFTYGVLARSKIPGLLLYGPPGTGKTLLAKAVAKDTRATVLEVSGADLNDKYVGEGEKNVKAVFSLARKLASRQGGCVIFIDEADAILSSRSSETSSRGHRETINQFLKEWDGMNEQGVFIMVATNRPFDLDDAVLRRLPRRILVDLPVKDDRKKILQIHLRDESLDESISLTALAEETRLFSGSDLKNLCVSAALACVKEEYESDLAKDVTSTFPAAANISSEVSKGHNSDVGLDESHNTSGSRKASTAEGPESMTHKDTEATPFSGSFNTASESNAPLKRRVLHRRHFDKALQEIGSSVSEDMGSLAAIRKFDERFGDKMARGKKKSRWGFGQVDAESEAAASERAARVRS